MKIVVDVPDEEYESYALAITFGMGSAAIRRILNGIPLPKGHGALKDTDKLIKDNGLDKATKYGNETKEQIHFSYDTMMMYEIFDLIDGAETIVEADKEGAEE